MENVEETIEEMEQDVWETFERGGTHMHNIIRVQLTNISKIDRKKADAIYAQLQEEGY